MKNKSELSNWSKIFNIINNPLCPGKSKHLGNLLLDQMNTAGGSIIMKRTGEIDSFINDNEDYIIYNPHSKNAIDFPVIDGSYNITPKEEKELSEFPNFDVSGSVKGMKEMYYGLGALLVRNGNYIYNVSSEPSIYLKFKNRL